MFGVCVCVFLCLCCHVFRYRLCNELITHPRSPTVCKIIKKLTNQPYAPKRRGKIVSKINRVLWLTLIMFVLRYLPNTYWSEKKWFCYRHIVGLCGNGLNPLMCVRHSSAAVARKETARKHSLRSAMLTRMVVRDRSRCCVLWMLVMLLSDSCSFVMLGDFSVTVTVNLWRLYCCDLSVSVLHLSSIGYEIQ
jgi:hypothetical protein